MAEKIVGFGRVDPKVVEKMVKVVEKWSEGPRMPSKNGRELVEKMVEKSIDGRSR